LGTPRSKPKEYLVLRTFQPADDGYNGGTASQRYVKTTCPEPGETCYHGAFNRIADQGDGKFDEVTYHYVPKDPKQVTTSVYNGPPCPGSSTEVF
jgi:hypothetical protein